MSDCFLHTGGVTVNKTHMDYDFIEFRVIAVINTVIGEVLFAMRSPTQGKFPKPDSDGNV